MIPAVDQALKIRSEADAAAKSAIGTLLKQREDIDSQLAMLGYSEGSRAPEAKARKCGNCAKEGHSARTCTQPKN